MTTLPDRPNSALLVIDVQNGVVARAHERDAVIAHINTAVDRARQAGAPVIWVQHESKDLPTGSDVWKIVPELSPKPAEPVIHKRYGDAFEETDLEGVLAQNGVGRVVISGAQTDACVRCTMHGALARGYDVALASDAHTTEDLSQWGAPPPGQVVAHTNLYWTYQTAPGRTAEVAKAQDVAF